MEKIKEIEEQMDEEETNCLLSGNLQKFLEYQGVQSFIQRKNATDLIIKTVKEGNYYAIGIEVKFPNSHMNIKDGFVSKTTHTINDLNLKMEQQIIGYMIKYTHRYGQKISDYLISTAVDNNKDIAVLTVHR